jgi:hypothetical protein
MKIRAVGAELFLADRRTDMKLIVAFRNFANAPKKRLDLPVYRDSTINLGIFNSRIYTSLYKYTNGERLLNTMPEPITRYDHDTMTDVEGA